MTENKTPKTWTQQEDEKDKRYYFFQQFIQIEEPIKIDKFYKLMEKKRKDDEISYKLPTLKTLYNWSSEHGWIKRKEAYRKYLLSKVGEEIDELFISSLVEKFRVDSENRLLISKEINSILKDEDFEGSKAWNIEKLMRSNKDGLEIERLIAGEPTEIIQAENNNTHQVTGLDNLANTLETSRQKRKKTS